jgi:hypothetical protein
MRGQNPIYLSIQEIGFNQTERLADQGNLAVA